MDPVDVCGTIHNLLYSIRAFACREPGCPVLYNITHGYFYSARDRSTRNPGSRRANSMKSPR